MSNLNKDKLYPGSTIFIINTSEYYMLNGNKQWIKINPYGIGNSSESDSGGSESENEEISYDGGSIDDSDPV